ncbi:hypothetical protein A2U01_0095325, partial [Trifolium medium]|nr:hypothetical protein [Trifolium medium]
GVRRSPAAVFCSCCLLPAQCAGRAAHCAETIGKCHF